MPASSATVPTFIVFDADVLIKLAQHPGNLEAIKTITKAVQDNTYHLVVPEPVLSAFNREKQPAAERYWKIQRDTIKKLRQLRQAFPFADDISAFADVEQRSG
jgi:rRNA-processing protein FCF1